MDVPDVAGTTPHRSSKPAADAVARPSKRTTKRDRQRTQEATAPLSGVAAVLQPWQRPAQLDGVDVRILEILARDARASQREIARQLEMSPSAIGERIAAMTKSGVIRGYTIDVDWGLIGRGLQVYIAVSAVEGRLGDVAASLANRAEVEEVSFITGDDDIIAKVRFRDHEHFRRFIVTEIWEESGINDTRSLVSLGEVANSERWMPKVIRSIVEEQP